MRRTSLLLADRPDRVVERDDVGSPTSHPAGPVVLRRDALRPVDVVRLQSAAGNHAVQRLLRTDQAPGRPAPAETRAITVQRWPQYTTEYAESLADSGKIKLFDDRLDHIMQRHGPNGEASGATFHRFLTDKRATIKGYILTALKSGSVTKSPGQAFDFEKTFDNVIGKDTEGDEVKRIRVVVVEVGKSGNGKVQTAYPVP